MRYGLKTLTFAVAVFALQGCATNALRLEYAGDVAAQGQIAAAASREFLVKVDAARVTANLDLIALDADCRPKNAFLRRAPLLTAIKDPKAPPRGWLCTRAHVEGQTHETPISLAPMTNDLEPTFVLIASLASYSNAISAILEQETIDPGAEFLETVALAQSAGNLIKAISGSGPTVPGTDDPRVSAIAEFVTFLGELAEEADQVKQLREFAASDKGNGAVIMQLRDHLANWELGRKGDENLRYLQTQIMLEANLQIDPPLPPAQRRELAKGLYDRAAALNSSARLFSALDATLQELADADADLRRVLKKNPNLTAAERQKVGRLNRQRVTRALQALTSIVTSFSGA
jgi:hypothetical protein